MYFIYVFDFSFILKADKNNQNNCKEYAKDISISYTIVRIHVFGTDNNNQNSNLFGFFIVVNSCYSMVANNRF
jgi:hypothetical protein